MRAMRAAAYVVLVPSLMASSGCDPATITLVLSDPKVQGAIASVTIDVAAKVVTKVGPWIYDRVFPAAEAHEAPSAAGSPNPDATQPAEPPPELVEASRRTAAVMVGAPDVVQRSSPDSEKLSFECHVRESNDDCIGRFRTSILEHGYARVDLMAQAYGECRPLAVANKELTDIIKVTTWMNQCVAGKGFAAEVAALDFQNNA